MSDIVPELKKKIDKTFDELVEADESLSGLIETIKTQGTWDDAQSCASKIGQHRSRAFLQNISSDILPNGQMYYNIANRIIPPALQSDYDLISEVCMEVQEQVNEAARIGIRAQQADLNTDRIDGIVNRISSEPFDDVKWLLDAPIENFMRSVVDDHVEKNADFHYKSGLNPVIKRTTDGKCCEWCTNLAGEYPYKPGMNREVFRRHENCGCTVAYYPDAKSKVFQDVWNKHKYESSDDITIERKRRTSKNYGSYSGALNNENDPYMEKREKVAKKFYEEIRNRNIKSEVGALYQSLKKEGFSKADIEKAINHIFVKEHYFNEEIDGSHFRRFDASYDMMQSYIRLREGKKIQPHDIIMMKHELYEATIMENDPTIPYEEAHAKAEKVYNYSEAWKEYKRKYPKGEA